MIKYANRTFQFSPTHPHRNFLQEPVRILIVEDHSLLRNGIKHVLSSVPNYCVVGEIGDGLEVYAACQRLNPDLVLIDLSLPGMNGIDVIQRLKKRWPELMVVVITADTAEFRAHEALTAGAIGYVLKKSSQQTLLAALQAALMGKLFLDEALDHEQIMLQNRKLPASHLTPRERHILKLISEGDRNRDIAEKLKITIKTVETHRLNLMRKLDAHNIAELVHWANRLGIK
jgi:two-component system secretion response regulator SsrB